MEHGLPIQGYAVLDTNSIVGNDNENMIRVNSEGKLHIHDVVVDNPSVRVAGQWIGFLELIHAHPDYAMQILTALLAPCRGSYANMRNSGVIPDTFEEFLSVLTGNPYG